MELRRSRLETMLKVLDVDGAVRRVKGGWTATGQPWTYDAERYAWVARQRAAEQQAMRDYVSTTECRMEFLQRQLDDEGAKPCGRCDNCAGARYTAEASAVALDAARADLGRAGVEVEPRRMWPTGLPAIGVDLKGRIPAGEQAAQGRALGRLSDIGWGNRLRPLLAPKAPDGPVPDDVARAAVGVLADWARGPGGWAPGVDDAQPRPVGVVTVASGTRPQLVRSLGARIAETGRLPLLGQCRARASSINSPAATAPSGSRPSPARWPSRPSSRRRSRGPEARCSWWTTTRRQGGHSPSRPGCCGVRVRRECCRWYWPYRADPEPSSGGWGY
ncbi:hypothetical protein SALBM217S_04270 [Streptomyces griseoloalbus]